MKYKREKSREKSRELTRTNVPLENIQLNVEEIKLKNNQNIPNIHTN